MKPVFLLLVLLACAVAHAQNCNLTVSMGSFTAAVQSLPQTLPHSMAITRTGSNSSNCNDYRIFFGKGQANAYQRAAYSGSNAMPYNIYRTVNRGDILKDFSDAGPNEYLTSNIPTLNVPRSVTWYVGVDNLEKLFNFPPGVYTDVVPINIYSVKSNGTLEYQTTRSLTLSFTIPRHAELSLVPENAPHNPSSTSYVMDFGTLESQEVLGADMRVVGNVGFGVMLSSQNGGRLMNGPYQVPYMVSVDNAAYFIPTPAGVQYTVAMRGTGTNISGQRYNMKVRIGNIPDNQEDGDYQDVLTITVQAW